MTLREESIGKKKDVFWGNIGSESFASALEFRTGGEKEVAAESERETETKSRQMEANAERQEAEDEHDRASVSAHTPPQVGAITKDRETQKEKQKEAKRGCILLPLN